MCPNVSLEIHVVEHSIRPHPITTSPPPRVTTSLQTSSRCWASLYFALLGPHLVQDSQDLSTVLGCRRKAGGKTWPGRRSERPPAPWPIHDAKLCTRGLLFLAGRAIERLVSAAVDVGGLESTRVLGALSRCAICLQVRLHS